MTTRFWRKIADTGGPDNDGWFYDDVAGNRFISAQATGVAPFVVASTTRVDNLTAHYLGAVNQDAAFFQNAANLNAGTIPSARLTGTYAISISGTAANASALNSQPASYYLDSANLTGTIASARLSGTYAIAISGNAATATALQTARTIAGKSFNGTANVTLSALTAGVGFTAASQSATYDGSTARTWDINASTSAALAGSLVMRDPTTGAINVTTLNAATAVLSTDPSASTHAVRLGFLQPAWTNVSGYNTGWTAVAAGHQQPQYRKVGDRVFFAGSIQRSGATTLAGSTAHLLFTMPVGFRPTATTQLGVVATISGPCGLEMNTSGQVFTRAQGFPMNTGGTTGYPTGITIPLEGLSFAI